MDKIISIGGTNDPNTITINSNLNREIINYKVNTSIFQNGSLSNMLDANGNNVLELLNHTAGSLSIDKIIRLLEEHKKGKRDNSRKIWTIYVFLIWYQEYFVKR